MNIVNVNPSKTDLIEYVSMATYNSEKKLIGFRQSMFFDIDNEVNEKSMINIQRPISISKIETIFVIKNKKLEAVSANEFKELIKKIEKVK